MTAPTWWPGLRDWANRQLFRAGERVAPHLAPGLVRRSGAVAGRVMTRLDGTHLRTYRDNLRQLLGREPDEQLLQAGIASWVRNYVEVLALGRWSAGEINQRVHIPREELLHTEFAEHGAVIALPHSGNWDLAGAWACLNGMPVTTVAEHLGEAEFAAYTRIRGHLGMQVLAHDDPTALRQLVRAAGTGRLVCLLSERVFDGAGVTVTLGGRAIRMPAGPAMVARTSGAALIAGVCHYTERGMVIDLSDPVPHRPGRDGLVAMTQDVANWFTARLREHPEDWHMMQSLRDADD
ncbi:phosphatidylinositol mannoside acyltransferase [Enemella dayhoffiae]|uniref:phosphatidylinositol mannoside acyltransferase n=1 Tax=Enemella dayhoffiae TaxID=2016507 RepID=UPI00159549F8|nr:phosphatidylinositol mannoside acyltransferase [Enemella dayhoffiae]